MSRRITIKSDVSISELDLAEEVVNELRERGARGFRFDSNERVFFNNQYDDVADNTIQEAEQLYGIKLQQRMEKKIVERLKKRGYTIKRVEQSGEVKIIAKQKVYV